MTKFFKTALMLALAAQAVIAMETPHTPFKDGYANPVLFYGQTQTLKVRGTETLAWINYALAGGVLSGLQGARLLVYAAAVHQTGVLQVKLAKQLSHPEDATPFSVLQPASDSSVGMATVRTEDAGEMVNIPLDTAFLAALREGRFDGFIFYGTQGLDLELGALESSRGAVLFLDYGHEGITKNTIPPISLHAPSSQPRVIHRDIGMWNMEQSELLTMDSGVNPEKIRSVTVLIRRDVGESEDAVVIPLESAGMTRIIGGRIELSRKSGGLFEHGGFSAENVNRGWIRIEYVD